MKDQEYNAIRDYCKPIALEWITRLGVGWDRVELHWKDEYFSQEIDGHGRDVAAYCAADWRYLHASITFSVAKLAEYFEDGRPTEHEYVEELIIHEIAHILVNEMREYDGSRHSETVGHEERVVTRMARAFQYTFKAGVKSVASAISREDLRGAIARGWCHEVNSHKEMDANLAEAIMWEVEQILKSKS
jgi:hypothetical protein